MVPGRNLKTERARPGERSELGREEAVASGAISLDKPRERNERMSATAGMRPSSPSEERGERAERRARRALTFNARAVRTIVGGTTVWALD
jgi:hypothetical protein